jgi:hypothetical protein
VTLSSLCSTRNLSFFRPIPSPWEVWAISSAIYLNRGLFLGGCNNVLGCHIESRGRSALHIRSKIRRKQSSNSPTLCLRLQPAAGSIPLCQAPIKPGLAGLAGLVILLPTSVSLPKTFSVEPMTNHNCTPFLWICTGPWPEYQMAFFVSTSCILNLRHGTQPSPLQCPDTPLIFWF